MTDQEREDKLKALLDEAFLKRLAEVARLYGWSSDYFEIEKFITDLYLEIDLTPPDLEPYEILY